MTRLLTLGGLVTMLSERPESVKGIHRIGPTSLGIIEEHVLQNHEMREKAAYHGLELPERLIA